MPKKKIGVSLNQRVYDATLEEAKKNAEPGDKPNVSKEINETLAKKFKVKL